MQEKNSVEKSLLSLFSGCISGWNRVCNRRKTIASFTGVFLKCINLSSIFKAGLANMFGELPILPEAIQFFLHRGVMKIDDGRIPYCFEAAFFIEGYIVACFLFQNNIGKRMKNRSEEIKLRIFVAFLFLACVFLISLAHILKNRHKKEVKEEPIEAILVFDLGLIDGFHSIIYFSLTFSNG